LLLFQAYTFNLWVKFTAEHKSWSSDLVVGDVGIVVDFTNDCIVSPHLQVIQLTLREPALDTLKGKKKVVYRSDLPVPEGRYMDVSTIRVSNRLMQPPIAVSWD